MKFMYMAIALLSAWALIVVSGAYAGDTTSCGSCNTPAACRAQTCSYASGACAANVKHRSAHKPKFRADGLGNKVPVSTASTDYCYDNFKSCGAKACDVPASCAK